MSRQLTIRLMTLAVVGVVTGCMPLTDGAKQAAEVTKRIVADTKKSWSDVFTYAPKTGKQLPQTRYCYNTMTDVVCYDSVQNISSPLRGYQDGENISWIQPGGGSLGVSGGQPMAQADAAHVHVAPGVTVATIGNDIAVSDNGTMAVSVDTSSPVAAPMDAAEKPKSGPFHKKESPYMK